MINRFRFINIVLWGLFFGLISLPAYCFFSSLSYWTLNTNENESKILILGDSHVSGFFPLTEESMRDVKDFELLKDMLSIWNTFDKVGCLIESNPWVAGKNKEVRTYLSKKPGPSQYFGMYYTLPEYNTSHSKELSNMVFCYCDLRDKACFETKSAIGLLKNMFNIIHDMLESNKDACINKDGLQVNMNILLVENSTVTVQMLLDELIEKSTIIHEKIENSKEYLDKITYDTLQNYVNSLDEERKKIVIFFQDQNNELTKSTFEDLIFYITKEVELDKKDQSDRLIALSCIKKSLIIINDFSEWYEKATNYLADAGFILTLTEQKKLHDKIVLFCGNNHAIAVTEYLKLCQNEGKACQHFAQGSFEYRYKVDNTTNIKEILPDIFLPGLFCIPFNIEFEKANIQSIGTSSEQIANITRPYICSYCSAISVEQIFSPCGGKCKIMYYCSQKCQMNDWKKHKKNCSRNDFKTITTHTQVSDLNENR